jgi:hypothetical protein
MRAKRCDPPRTEPLPSIAAPASNRGVTADHHVPHTTLEPRAGSTRPRPRERYVAIRESVGRCFDDRGVVCWHKMARASGWVVAAILTLMLGCNGSTRSGKADADTGDAGVAGKAGTAGSPTNGGASGSGAATAGTAGAEANGGTAGSGASAGVGGTVGKGGSAASGGTQARCILGSATLGSCVLGP